MIEGEWKKFLAQQLDTGVGRQIRQFVVGEREEYVVYPSPTNVFKAFEMAPFENIKVVIIGQDPYIGEGQAHGLSFSVLNGSIPPSLKNIYKEISTDTGGPPKHNTGDLSAWAAQGVFLLNSALTVRAGEAGSHSKCGWHTLTQAAVQKISDELSGVVFLLWGKHAAQVGSVVDLEKHYVLKAAHPSPLSAHNGFFGCKHFSQTNQILQGVGKSPIEW